MVSRSIRPWIRLTSTAWGWGRGLPWCVLLLVATLASSARASSFSGPPYPSSGESAVFDLPDVEVPHEDSLHVDCAASCPSPDGSKRGLYSFADALFWTVREGSADNWAQVITPHGALVNYSGAATLVGAPFDWNAGFRVGVGNQRSGDDLETNLNYTNFTTRATSHTAGEVYSAFLGNFFVDNADGESFGPHYRSASIQWDFDYHTIDLEVRRAYTIAPNLVVRPFLGLKAAIINQSLSSRWNLPIDTEDHTYLFLSATENLEQHFWGIGPSVGVTLEIPLYVRPRYTLRLFGTPSASLMYGRWTFRDVYANDGLTSTTVPTTTTLAINMRPITSAATMVGGAMGIEWTQQLSKATVVVRVGYEAQVWLNQMQFYSYNMGRLNNLTSLHGGTVKLCIDY
ncbi:MAG: hypothetical protein JW818_06510 [Pirellulales bacterium]|nr:hypothetical protein [Pirellulales bacterium]